MAEVTYLKLAYHCKDVRVNARFRPLPGQAARLYRQSYLCQCRSCDSKLLGVTLGTRTVRMPPPSRSRRVCGGTNTFAAPEFNRRRL